jgi:hypothetical protein
VTTRQAGTGSSGGYRKNWPKWLALYLVVGGIAYFIFYLVTSSGGGGGSGGGY